MDARVFRAGINVIANAIFFATSVIADFSVLVSLVLLVILCWSSWGLDKAVDQTAGM